MTGPMVMFGKMFDNHENPQLILMAIWLMQIHIICSISSVDQRFDGDEKLLDNEFIRGDHSGPTQWTTRITHWPSTVLARHALPILLHFRRLIILSRPVTEACYA